MSISSDGAKKIYNVCKVLAPGAALMKGKEMPEKKLFYCDMGKYIPCAECKGTEACLYVKDK